MKMEKIALRNCYKFVYLLKTTGIRNGGEK